MTLSESITIIREAGFFRQYESLNEMDFLDTLHQIKKGKYSERFGSDYEPERKIDLYSIVGQDTNKFLDIDLEADVCTDNKVYIWLLNTFANASNGLFVPTNINEVWTTEEGPIKVSFISNGQAIIFEPEYIDDWIDGRIFEVINIEMAKVSNELFTLCSGPNDDWFGQNIIHIRLTHEEKNLLKNKLSWNFPGN